MPLNLKQTPADEYRKAQKSARKSAKRNYRCLSAFLEDSEASSSSRKRVKPSANDYCYASDGEEVEYGPQPAASSPKLDYETIRAQMEEERFREKMMLDDDDQAGRLDGLEAHFHGFTQHIPSRHRGMMEQSDPTHLEDEEYAEWVRAEMWKRKHAEEHAEQERIRAAKAARKAQKQALKEEAARLEREMEVERRKRRMARDGKKWDEAREVYETRWRRLLSGEDTSELRFEDIPWPVFSVHLKSSKPQPPLSISDFSVDAMTSFLVPTKFSVLDALGIQPAPEANTEKEKDFRKKKLRETILRFHPDKFNARILGRVRLKDQELVKEAVGCVVRAVSDMMEKV